MTRLADALAARRECLERDPRHTGALRLFAGFYEGDREVAVDAYATTLVVHDYSDRHDDRASEAVGQAIAFYRVALPWLTAVVVKPRRAANPAVRRGSMVAGGPVAREVREDGVRYSVDLLAFRDAGFYLDTRHLRSWLRAQMGDKNVLNAFAYTGALGIAAQAGGATRVVQLDANRAVLNVAKTSATLNGLPIRKGDYVAADFWVATARMRRAGTTFDCVIVDPPFFATAPTGTVDLAHTLGSLVNKVRPLVADGGHLVVINNALFVSGRAFLDELAALGADGYMALEMLVPVPEDVTGTAATRILKPPADPAPFNHATKIAVLRVTRRDGGSFIASTGRDQSRGTAPHAQVLG